MSIASQYGQLEQSLPQAAPYNPQQTPEALQALLKL